MAWTIEVAGNPKNFKTIDFETALKTNAPTEFSALIEFEALAYFSLIEIKNGATVEWRGFLEDKEIQWTKAGRYLSISGRDTKVILWKKYTENFSNMHVDTAGFFGKVSAVELIKFFLRTPKSDSVHDFPFNKSGWGIDTSRIADAKAARTSVGDPNWVFLRRRGYGWRNSGSPWNSTVDSVDAVIANAWNTGGAAPYLNAADGVNYIYEDTDGAEAIFSFSDLPASTGVNRCTLNVSWKPDGTWYWWLRASMEIWISPDGGTSWVFVAEVGGKGKTWLATTPWITWTWDVSHILDTVTKVNAARIKLICTSKADGLGNKLSINVDWAYLATSYETGGEQDFEDVFDIPFQAESIMGIYIESRMDNDSYARNYKICTVSEDKQDFDSDYSEVDPNNHINAPSDYHMDFDAYNDEIAYAYRDFGANYFEEYFRHIIDIKVITNPIPDPTNVNVAQNYSVNAWTMVNNDFTHVPAAPDLWIDDDDGDTSYISDACQAIFVGDYDEYWTFAELPAAYDGMNWSINTLKIHLKAKLVAGGGGPADSIDLRVRIWDGSSWNVAGELNFSTTSYVDKSIDISGILDTIAKFNAARIHIEFSGLANGGATKGSWRCTWAYLELDADIWAWDIRAGVYAVTNDLGELYDLELNHSSHINISIERDVMDSPDGPVIRLYAHGGSTISPEIDETKTYRLVITRVGGTVTVVIYEDDVYFATLTRTGLGTTKYRYLLPALTANSGENVHFDIDLDDYILETETDLLGGNVTANTYRDIVHSWTPVTIDNIRIRIVAQDLSHAWAISQIYIYKAEDCDYRVFKETGCTPTYAEEQYIQALDFESAYTTPIGPLNVPKARLLDVINMLVRKCHTTYVPYEWWLALNANNTFHFKNRRGSDIAGITFVKGTNLEAAERNQSVRDTVQRVTIQGRGKGKRQEKISSDWVNDTTAMGNANTFFEDVISRKTEVDKDEAEVLAEIFLEEEAEPKDKIIVYVSNDTYTPLQYNVGDKVTVTDSLTGTSGLNKIFNIKKKIDKNGPHVTLFCGYQREDDGDTWEDIYRRMKELEITESLVADWMGEGVKEDRVDAKETLTTFFEKTAKNDTEEIGKDIKDPSWYMEPNPDAYNVPVDAFNAGPAARGTPPSYEYPNGRKWTHESDWMKLEGSSDGSAVRTLLVELRGDTGETLDVYMRDNPKLVFEMKCVETGGLSWFNGDFFDIGLYDYANSKGFLFRVTRSAAGFTLEAVWNLTGSDEQTMTVRTLSSNTKYRFEMITEVDRNLVIFNVYDLSVDEKYPVSVVAMDIDLSMLIRPLSMLLSSDNNADEFKQAIVYIYKFRTEWERVTSGA